MCELFGEWSLLLTRIIKLTRRWWSHNRNSAIHFCFSLLSYFLRQCHVPDGDVYSMARSLCYPPYHFNKNINTCISVWAGVYSLFISLHSSALSNIIECNTGINSIALALPGNLRIKQTLPIAYFLMRKQTNKLRKCN